MPANLYKYDPVELSLIKRACRLSSEVLDKLTIHIKPGISTCELDRISSELISKAGGKSVYLEREGYPRAIRTSVNAVIAGVPSASEILKLGDILNVDVALELEGWYGNSSRMYYVGKVPKFAQLLCERAYEALESAIQSILPGNSLRDVANTIRNKGESYGYSVYYCGHLYEKNK